MGQRLGNMWVALNMQLKVAGVVTNIYALAKP